MVGLTAEFGMGSGVSPPLSAHQNRITFYHSQNETRIEDEPIINSCVTFTKIKKANGHLVPVSSIHYCTTRLAYQARSLQATLKEILS